MENFNKHGQISTHTMPIEDSSMQGFLNINCENRVMTWDFCFLIITTSITKLWEVLSQARSRATFQFRNLVRTHSEEKCYSAPQGQKRRHFGHTGTRRGIAGAAVSSLHIRIVNFEIRSRFELKFRFLVCSFRFATEFCGSCLPR